MFNAQFSMFIGEKQKTKFNTIILTWVLFFKNRFFTDRPNTLSHNGD